MAHRTDAKPDKAADQSSAEERRTPLPATPRVRTVVDARGRPIGRVTR